MASSAPLASVNTSVSTIPSLNSHSGSNLSWREAARALDTAPPPPNAAYPHLQELERAELPTLRTQRAAFDCRICPHCSRPMLASKLREHVADCAARTSAASTGDKAGANPAGVPENGPNAAGASTNANAGPVAAKTPAMKKRKLDGKKVADGELGDSSEKVKKRTKPKVPKAPKSKALKPAKPAKEKPSQVYNADRNCGVPLPNGQPCMRSLTCKQHPMGAKRAVQGRSLRYDVLLNNYHRQHQMRQAQQTANAANAAQLEYDEMHDTKTQENPEREVQQVLDGVARAYCPPLATGEVNRYAFRAHNFRLREMLSMSLLPKKLPPTGELMYGRSLAFRPQSPDELAYVRSQAVQQAYYVAQLQQQRQQQLRRQQASVAKDLPPVKPVSPVPPLNPSLPGTPISKDVHMDPPSSRLMAQQRLKTAKE